MARRTKDSLRSRQRASFPKKPKKGSLNQFAGMRPVIISGPDDWFGDEGQLAQFTVTAISEDGSPLTYQWREHIFGSVVNLADDAEFSGVNTNTLQVSSIDENDQGREFSCRVCNPHTCVNSDRASINVTNITYNMISETGSQMIDEPATNNIVDERSP